MSLTRSVRVPRPPKCYCGNAEADDDGNIVRVRTCPVCMRLLLASMRGSEYAVAYLSSGDTATKVLLKQKEFFRFTP